MGENRLPIEEIVHKKKLKIKFLLINRVGGGEDRRWIKH
jgi:hypothetical protein